MTLIHFFGSAAEGGGPFSLESMSRVPMEMCPNTSQKGMIELIQVYNYTPYQSQEKGC